jgi:hypothetical protein
MNSTTRQLADQLLQKAPLYIRDRIDWSGLLPPAQPGVYGWWFLEGSLPMVPTMGCLKREDRTLLYVGVARKKANATTILADRILGCHFDGKATNSTLRSSLGVLLGKQLGTIPTRVSATNWNFGRGESKLSDWMLRTAAVNWVVANDRKTRLDLEDYLIQTCDLPLNLDRNERHPFHHILATLRLVADLNADTSSTLELRKRP